MDASVDAFTETELTYLRRIGSNLSNGLDEPQRIAAARVSAALELALGRRSLAARGRTMLASLFDSAGAQTMPAPRTGGNGLQLVASPFTGADTEGASETLSRELRDAALEGVGSVAVASEIERILECSTRNYRRAEVAIIPDFLAESGYREVLRFAAATAGDLKPTAIVADGIEDAKKAEYRSSLSTSAQRLRPLLLPILRENSDPIRAALRFEDFVIEDVEIQYTVSLGGDHYGMHTDGSRLPASGGLQSRLLTFVYYFHAAPKAFTGGELRIYDTVYVRESPIAAGPVVDIVPQSNTAVFFDSALLHEVLTVKPLHGPLTAESGRRTVNGWLHGRPRQAASSNA